MLATAINEAVATGFDGIMRIAPAWPTSWGVTGTVYVQGKSKVHVQFQNGAVAFAVLEAGHDGNGQRPQSLERNAGDGHRRRGAAGRRADDRHARWRSAPSRGAPISSSAGSDATPSAVRVTGTAATASRRSARGPSAFHSGQVPSKVVQEMLGHATCPGTR